ncbi:alpha/beta fold hydrolase [Comamonas sp. NoAH]|uniref:alpha/beta fold hydrolase n=1 Tax=Comamonas halotolerans TaxID=3041496 RepID=UPI0024E0E345|nr:alpha/beta fold hydrolase [Comamonas sp. NoAH]
MVRTGTLTLPQGITLHCHSSGSPDRPLLVFLHGFPEGAFIWDVLMENLGQDFYCVAPNLRGYGASSQPTAVEDYRPKVLVHDLVTLIERLSPGRPAACVIAHDWGGALAWNLANQHQRLLQQLLIINAPHPGSFVRELQNNPAQQAASQYMHYLRRPDAAQRLLANDGAQLFSCFQTKHGHWPSWLTQKLRTQYLAHWKLGLHGACAYYAASPLVPPRGDDRSIMGVDLPESMLRIEVPTRILWGDQDTALLPALLDGLHNWVHKLHIQRVPDAGHWLVHEKPALVEQSLRHILRSLDME